MPPSVNWGTFNGGFDIADPGNTFTLSQAIDGSGSFTKAGPGKLVLAGVSSLSTYTGGTTLPAACSKWATAPARTAAWAAATARAATSE